MIVLIGDFQMATGKFRTPNLAEQLLAIGIKTKPNDSPEQENQDIYYELCHTELYRGKAMPDNLLKAIIPESKIFKNIPKPKADDWLQCHSEKGQTFAQFAQSVHNIPDPRRNIIYIVPLAFFEKSVPNDVLHDLVDFASYFFCMPVQLLKQKSLAKKVSHRSNDHTKLPQVHAGEILTSLQSIVPRDAFCVAAITLCDLYPRDSWNFVFGLANLQSRTGVYSLARFLPGFFEGLEPDTANMTKEERATLLTRACRLMCHEIGHMFGLKHCIFFHCLMNGSNHFEESEKRPFSLCPICLRKLQHSCNFDFAERYDKMADFCKNKNMHKETDWFGKRVHHLT